MHIHDKIAFPDLKTVFLLNFSSGRWVSELRNLCWEEPFIRFEVNRVVLMIPSFLPKVTLQ